MVKRWYADFKRCRTDTNDAERPGHLNSAVVPENTQILHKLILADCKLKYFLDSRGVEDIRRQHFAWTFVSLKLCLKWVLRLLTVDQKQQCVDNSERCLQMFQHNKKEFLRKYVTMAKTWIHHFTPESNRQSAEKTTWMNKVEFWWKVVVLLVIPGLCKWCVRLV